MAATFSWGEDNGTLTSGHGTTRSGFGADTHYPTDSNWKNVDDCTANSGTAYTASPVVAGTNSFIKYQFGKFSGSYNQILNVKWSTRTAPTGALGTGLHLYGKVTSTYATPSTSAMTGQTDYTSAEVAIGSGTSVNLGADPSTAASSTLAAGGGYTQYLASQLLTDVTAAAGDMASITSTLQYDES